ncbi:MAG: DUF1549 domain-containing protein, partial [Chitinophagia bacterium]|nr:DUF1549 domain-containing protein [Chitinophagia bacterium]
MNGLNRFFLFFIFLTAVLQLVSCTPDLPKDIAAAYEQLPEKMDYNLHVKPLLSDKCFSCHGPDKAKQKAGLRLDIQSFAYAELPESPGKVAIDPGNLNGSELFHRIISEDPEYKMPSQKSHLVLSAKEKAILIKWIKQGAEYKAHWAFVKPEKEEIPEIPFKNWAINPIDNFIGHTLALEKLHLLQSPHYGEKMAVDWLDLARFADSHGYTVDRIRDMSPYRDWVIGAFNKNMPFNQFIQWQLAGDLMPNPSKEMLIATAFNRVHQQNMEGGIIDEEFQTEYVIDRTNTAGTAIMGLPIGCARCHDHKYDPISQKNYYEMFSFFNKVKEAGQISWDDAMPSPTILLPSAEKENMLRFIQSDVIKQEKKLLETKNNSSLGFQNWIKSKK